MSLLEEMGTRWRERSARGGFYQVLLVRTADSDKGSPPPLPSPPHRLLKTILDVKDLPLVLRTGITQGEES